MELAKADIYFEKGSTLPFITGLVVHLKVEANGQFSGYFPIQADEIKQYEANLNGRFFLKLHDGRCGEMQVSSSRLKQGNKSIVEFKSIGLITPFP